MLYCPNFFCNVLQVWMTGKDVYLQITWSWPDKTWNILCSYCLQWNTSQSKFRNHYFLFLFAFSILSQLFLIWGCMKILSTSASNSHQSFYGRNWHCYRMIVTVNVRLFFCDTVKPLVCRHYIIKVQTLLNIMYSKCFTLLQILQIKVDRLEHLVHLKDLRIEDLTKHLERYKARNSWSHY